MKAGQKLVTVTMPLADFRIAASALFEQSKIIRRFSKQREAKAKHYVDIAGAIAAVTGAYPPNDEEIES